MTRVQNYAVNLFKFQYGKTPEEAGYPVNDYLEGTSLYLYSDSKEAIDAFKTMQKILRGIIKYFLPSLILALVLAALIVWKINAEMIVFACVGLAITLLWGVILAVLAIYCHKQKKRFKGHPILVINYKDVDD